MQDRIMEKRGTKEVKLNYENFIFTSYMVSLIQPGRGNEWEGNEREWERKCHPGHGNRIIN